MTIAFIISAVIAGILFFLLISKRDELKKAEDQTERLNSRLQEMMKESNATKDFRLQAILEDNMIDDIIRDNGFVPHRGDDGWIYFKKQGETYLISPHTLPHVQFYKEYDLDNCDVDALKEAAQIAMNDAWVGRISISEDGRKLVYRMFGVERTQAHFYLSFMDYMNMLDDLIACHRYYYHKLLEEKQTLRVEDLEVKNVETQAPAPSKVLS